MRKWRRELPHRVRASPGLALYTKPCCSALVVIKNRPLPFWNQNPHTIPIYFSPRAAPQRLLGWKSSPLAATIKGREGLLSCKVDFFVLTLGKTREGWLAVHSVKSVSKDQQAADCQQVIVRVKIVSCSQKLSRLPHWFRFLCSCGKMIFFSVWFEKVQWADCRTNPLLWLMLC